MRVPCTFPKVETSRTNTMNFLDALTIVFGNTKEAAVDVPCTTSIPEADQQETANERFRVYGLRLWVQQHFPFPSSSNMTAHRRLSALL